MVAAVIFPRLHALPKDRIIAPSITADTTTVDPDRVYGQSAGMKPYLEDLRTRIVLAPSKDVCSSPVLLTFSASTSSRLNAT
jgi:hypothetical protein